MEKLIPAVVDELVLSIKELSDKSFQERVWLGKDLRLESSFTDVRMFLVDDLEEHLLYEYAVAIGLSTPVELVNLIKLFKEYDYKGKTDRQIIEDKDWDIIVSQAVIVLENISDKV
ncbi:MAG: hypothetical protein K8F24_00070 [Bacteroidales bacterium]|nr:hypothetical protein [Bacteroidales bacterium]